MSSSADENISIVLKYLPQKSNLRETLIKSLRTVNRMGSLQCLKLHQAARSAWGLGRSPILKLKEALKDTLRLMLLDRFQQLLKINQRFLRCSKRHYIRYDSSLRLSLVSVRPKKNFFWSHSRLSS